MNQSNEIVSEILEEKIIRLSVGRKIFNRALRNHTFLFGLLIIILFALLAAFPEYIAPHEPTTILSDSGIQPQSTKYPLGLDNLGRDVLSRVVYGARASFIVSFGSVTIALLIGVSLGLISGYVGGIVDIVICRILDAILAFPILLFAILTLALLGGSYTNLILTIGLIYMPYFARLARGSTLSIAKKEYVESSRAVGSSTWRIVTRTILPNIIVPITVQSSLALGVSMLIEANLSFLGLGVQPPTPSWGRMILESALYIRQNLLFMLTPGLCIFITILAYNLVGDGLRDILDPKLMD